MVNGDSLESDISFYTSHTPRLILLLMLLNELWSGEKHNLLQDGVLTPLFAPTTPFFEQYLSMGHIRWIDREL